MLGIAVKMPVVVLYCCYNHRNIYILTLCFINTVTVSLICLLTFIGHLNQHINPYQPSAFFVGHKQNSADPGQMLQNAASDEGLRCLLTECSVRI